jgi:SAM-dependent methyltransferase
VTPRLEALAAGVSDRLRAGWTAVRDPRRLPREFVEPLAGAKALEIGGPSGWFRSGGKLPVYEVVDSVDGCNYADDTLWGGSEGGGAYAPEGTPRGRMFILEAGDLSAIDSDSYDALLASHVIEHLADPIGALGEWSRVVRPGGHLLLIAPHKERTFDRRRPVTPLEHMVEDHERGVGEDDSTHFDEVIALHDMSRDRVARSDREGFEARTRDNLRRRGVHHHVFVTETLLRLLDHCGLEIRAVHPRVPEDIFCLARVPAGGERPDNARWLAAEAEWRARSPFELDRRPAAQAPRS